jgi:hypothetical protein
MELREPGLRPVGDVPASAGVLPLETVDQFQQVLEATGATLLLAHEGFGSCVGQCVKRASPFVFEQFDEGRWHVAQLGFKVLLEIRWNNE